MVFATSMMVPVFGCSEKTETTTGAACSIKDLNNLYNKHTVKAKANTTDRANGALRPVEIFGESASQEVYTLECTSGVCLLRLHLVDD